jgi:actin related protein 2/3 complex subunit 1A/1B
MSVAQIERISVCISAHDWSPDKQRVALCPDTTEIIIYKKSGEKYDPEHVLTEHDAVVTSIVWGKQKNRLLTCSQDRNAYVWTYTNGVWKPVLVILRLNRSATLCTWSPAEDKFAVSSGAQCVSICYFEQDNNWWVSKHIKKEFTSTVLCCDWHPNNVLIAAGGTDMYTRVYSGFIKQIDTRSGLTTNFGNKLPFGTLLGEWKNPAWVIATKWSPSGNKLAWTCHNSSLFVLHCSTTEERELHSVNYNLLPLRDFVWIDENTIIGGGYDCNLLLFECKGGSWQFSRPLDVKKETGGKGGGNVRDLWKNRTQNNQEDTSTDQSLSTRHQNSISVVRKIDNNTLSTTGLDGHIVVWDLKKLMA